MIIKDHKPSFFSPKIGGNQQSGRQGSVIKIRDYNQKPEATFANQEEFVVVKRAPNIAFGKSVPARDRAAERR